MFQTFTLAFLAADTSTFKVEDSTSSPSTSSGVIVNPANPSASVPEGGSAEGDSFTPQSLSPFNELVGSPSPALPEDNGSGIIFHRRDNSFEELSIVRLQMDSKQISTTLDLLITEEDPLSLLPDRNLSTINLSKINTVEIDKTNYPNQTDGRIQDGVIVNDEEAGTNSSSITPFFDPKGLTSSLPYDSEESWPAEGSGSGSGLYSNRLNQEFDGVTAVKTDLSTSAISFKVDDTGKKSIEDSETGSKTSSEKEMEENESEQSGEEEEKVEGVTIIYTETGSGNSWPEDVSGSGDGGGDGEGKEKKVSDDEEGVGVVGEKDKGDGSEDSDGEPGGAALFDNNEENYGGGDGGDGHDEEGRNTAGANSTPEDNKEGDGDGEINGGLENEEQMEGGGNSEDGNAAVIGESFSSEDGFLLFDAATSRPLGRLVPLLRLTDGNEALEDQTEGKCSLCFSVTE